MFHPVAGSEFAAVALVEDSGVFNDDVDIEIELQLLEQVTDRVVVKADQPFFPQEIIVLGDRGGFKLPVFHVGLFVGSRRRLSRWLADSICTEPFSNAVSKTGFPL